MDYRFEISLPNSSEFRCEIAINGEQTFQQFHDKIVETLGYDGSQMASFFTLDKVGNRVKEIALMEMSTDDDDSNTLVMDVTMIREIVNASCIELEYVFDFFANKYFKVEYAGEYIGDSADVLPLCVYCDGEIPLQSGFEAEEDWGFEKSEEEYDDSYLDEFGEGGRNSDDEDYNFDDDEDYKEDDYDDDGGKKYNDKYESLDDYIDKL